MDGDQQGAMAGLQEVEQQFPQSEVDVQWVSLPGGQERVAKHSGRYFLKAIYYG